MSILAYFLSDDAKDAYKAEIVPGTRNHILETTWPYVMHALIRRFLTDDVLQTAHEEVIRATQRDSEDEMDFVQRIMDAFRVCRNSFLPAELVN